MATEEEFQRNLPAPFPDDVPVIDLKEISLAKLINGDGTEANRVHEACITDGFFYLNLMDHPKGAKMWQAANLALQVGGDTLGKMPMQDKWAFKQREASRKHTGVLDLGYRCLLTKEDGTPDTLEIINLPVYEMCVEGKDDIQLPPWISEHEKEFQNAMRDGNWLANIIFGILEKALQLETGALTSMHRLNERSSDFLRVLRYPRFEPGKSSERPGFDPHRDVTSMAILFTWLGGLQLPDRNLNLGKAAPPTEEGWHYVKPKFGHAVINLGDAMQILTGDHLKSGLHRVVRGPGEQVHSDRYSVLLGIRPQDATLMKPIKGPTIPQEEPEEILTAREWGIKTVRKVLDVLEVHRKPGTAAAC